MASANVKNLATGGMSGVLSGDRRQYYYKPNEFAELFKDVTPYLSLSLRNRVKLGNDPIFKLFQYENTYMRQYFQNNGSSVTIAAASSGASAESSAVTIDNVTGFGLTTTIDASFVHKTFDVWDSTVLTDPKNATYKGTVVLTDDTSTTTAKFKNFGGTAIATVDNDVFVYQSVAAEDGSEAPDATATELSTVWGQVQTFKTAVQLEGAILRSSLRGASNELVRHNLLKMKEHKLAIDKAFMWGQAPAGTNLDGSGTFTDSDQFTGDTGRVIRSTYGICRAIEDYGSTSGDFQNKWTVTAGTFKYADYVAMTEKMFQYDPPNQTLYALCGLGAMSYWSTLEYARSSRDNWIVQLSARQPDKTFGWSIRMLETPHGMLKLTPSMSLKYERNNYMLIPDDRYINYMDFKSTVFMQDILKENAYDGQKNLYWTEAGNGITHIKTHSRVVIQ
jgi:hypothetical protein